jgi:L-alanine-DL-glutamate epimerase-like enolase superfamily enzyme
METTKIDAEIADMPWQTDYMTAERIGHTTEPVITQRVIVKICTDRGNAGLGGSMPFSYCNEPVETVAILIENHARAETGFRS